MGIKARVEQALREAGIPEASTEADGFYVTESDQDAFWGHVRVRWGLRSASGLIFQEGGNLGLCAQVLAERGFAVRPGLVEDEEGVALVVAEVA
jgi:hypothetical protein